MKVDVITINEARFRTRWSWWSMWVDIALFDFASEPYLIQMKVSRTNGKRFKAVNCTGRFYKQTTTTTVGSLTQMSGEKK